MLKQLSVLISFCLLLPSLSLAAHKKNLEERVTELEQKNAELYHELEEKKAAGLGTLLSDKISFSGLIEIEASQQNDEFASGNNDSNSDLTLATAQLGFNAKANEYLSADLVLLFEEGENDDDVTVDEGTINISFGPFSSRLGRQYVPFGNYYSHFISDPLTLELGETRETAALIAYEQESWSLAGFLFNGDIDKTGDEDHLSDFGFSLVLKPLQNLEMGASYLSDLSDADAEIVASYAGRVDGYSAYLVTDLGLVILSAEILGAVGDYKASDLDSDGNGTGDKPLAWNLEIATPLNDAIELAGRLEGSEEFAEMPELQYGACISWSPFEQLSLSFEYLRGEFATGFAPTDGAGSPQDTRDLFTAQLAFEF